MLSDISYECAAYRRQLPLWQRLDDVYKGDRAWLDYGADGSIRTTKKTRSYLPQEAGETDRDYESRVLRSHFSDKFSQAIKDFVGVIFNNGIELQGVPDAIAQHWKNLDGSGTGGARLCARVALQVLRRGHSFVLVDYPAFDESVVSLADMSGGHRHPIWTLIDPQQVINWRFERLGNRQVLTMAVIRSTVCEPDGFGEVEKTYYTLLTPGRYECYDPVASPGGKIDYVLVPGRSGQMGRNVRGRFEPFDFVPLVGLYGGDRIGNFESNPTLLSMAQLNVTHYQVKSDHRQKMHYCSFPTPVRVGGDGSDLILGPRTVVDVPVGGAFNWSEPNATSLAASSLEVKDLEREMDFLGSDYLLKPSDRQAAQTSLIQASKVESELYLFASDLAQGMTDCLSCHAAYLGLASGGQAVLDTKFFTDVGEDPQMLLALLQMRQNDDLSSGELRAFLERRKILGDSNESQ